MYVFKKFPAKIRYEQADKHGDNVLTRDVLIYGLLCDGHLVVVDELDVTADVYLLPRDVFEQRFKDYVLIEE